MSDPFFEKFVTSLVKGAAESEGFMRGGKVNVIVARGNTGREEKLANHAGIGALAGGMMLPGLGAPIGAAIGADEGQRGHAAIGSVLGGVGGAAGGGLLGGGLGALSGNPEIAKLLAMTGAGIGGVGGMMYGASKGGHKDSMMERVQNKLSAFEENYATGVKHATAKLGIKEAFLPLLGSLLGGTALRAGAGALARGAGGSALGSMAGKILPKMTGGIGGMATDMAGSMAGGAIGQKLQGPPQPPQM